GALRKRSHPGESARSDARQPDRGRVLEVRAPRAPGRFRRRARRGAGDQQPRRRNSRAPGGGKRRPRTRSHESRAQSARELRKGKMEMARKIYPYSLDRMDAKIAGVCSTIGNKYGVDPTFVRIGFVAAAIFISFKLTLVAYAALGVYLTLQKRNAMTGERHMSDFDRMGEVVKRKPTVHAMRTELDETDRRLMAIDHHINTQNDELAREIEALRQEEK